MLSYQHGFHAGNRADMLKHAVLDAILCELADGPHSVLHVETHAGRGNYDLTGRQARKTGEAEQGVLAHWDSRAPAALAQWMELVRECGRQAYPGSPALAARRLGPRDRMVLFEKHPAEFEALKGVFAGDRRVQIRKEDGYAGALRLSPRRGETLLAFADPSYETIADMERLAEWTPRALEKWPHAALVLWLPLFRDEREVEFGQFLAQLEDGVVAGARWPAPADGKDTALEGSAIVAYRIPQHLKRKASEIADTLGELWKD
ncbi:MAG: 23S rRNA (adenine(2030)-N(6))-methyltransferase RlmJ [Alphaproteobacteria bacterium]|nr:23S rRNA (adenine(2030)-N(6))-methyltransferase RlmJ [Alphaproteobacteria bacterium]